MGLDALNCQCNCSENQADSFIFEGVTDYYLPIKRKRNTYIKNANNIFCNSCKREENFEKLQEIDIKINKFSSRNIRSSYNNSESAQNFYNKKTSLGSNPNFWNSSENSSIYIHNLDERINDDLVIQIDLLIIFQSTIRGYLYRKKYKLKIKQELLNIENNLIKESIDKYTNNKIKLSEKLLGTFNKDNWKKYYKEGDKLFQKESRIIIAKKYNLKNILNNVYNFDFKPHKNPNFFINDLDDENEEETEQNYDIIKSIFRIMKKENYKKTFLCKLKFFSFINESIYIGSINLDGEKHGYGKLIQKNGMQMEGFWRDGVLEGWGRITDEEGCIMEGYFINGKINGKGFKKNLEGEIYEGDFFKGMKEGFGKEENKKILYEGEFHKNLKWGKGVCYFKLLDDKYEGEFENNTINGKGIYIWKKDGNYFKGNFINGQMNGTGLFVWKDGSKYLGNYKNNIKEGKGKFIWPNGKSFEGYFLNGKPHGKGIITLTDENNKIISSNEVEYDNGNLKFEQRI